MPPGADCEFGALCELAVCKLFLASPLGFAEGFLKALLIQPRLALLRKSFLAA